MPHITTIADIANLVIYIKTNLLVNDISPNYNLSMTEKKSNDLDKNSRDYFVATIEGAAGMIPVFGPPIAKAAGEVFPNQRVDRVVKFIRELENRVEDIELFTEKLQTPEGYDLLEDALYQSTRAMTEDRRIYLANMLKNGLTKEEQTHAEKKKLFDILNQLNDHEIILLKYHSFSTHIGSNHPFEKKHDALIRPASRSTTASEDDDNRAIYRDSYEKSLYSLGLVKEASLGARLTGLGSLVLEYIEVPED